MNTVLTYLGLNPTQRFISERSADFKSRLDWSLNSYGLDPEVLYDLLSQNNCVIAGSLPLSVLLEEPWTPSDINIFGTTESVVAINNYLSKYFNDGWNWNLDDDTDFFGYDTEDDVFHTTSYSLPKTNIRVTSFNTWTSTQTKLFVEELFDYFDFDFCKVAFDGNDLYINSPESLFTRSTNVKLLRVNDSTLHRIDEYISRGFKIDNVAEIHEYLDSFEYESSESSSEFSSEESSESNSESSDSDEVPELKRQRTDPFSEEPLKEYIQFD